MLNFFVYYNNMIQNTKWIWQNKKNKKNHKNKNPCLHACTGFQKQEFLFILADSDFTIIINIFFSVPQLLYHKINYFHLEVFFLWKKINEISTQRDIDYDDKDPFW